MDLIHNRDSLLSQRIQIMNKITGLMKMDGLISKEMKEQLIKGKGMNRRVYNIFGSIRSSDELKLRKFLFRILR